jgi:predicted NBD/HSP70 family sugar kinase
MWGRQMSRSFDDGRVKLVATPQRAASELARVFAEIERLQGPARGVGAAGIGSVLPGDIERDALIEVSLASVRHSAAMMREVLEETRRDRIDFEVRRRQIDRKLARIDETLEKAIGLSP